MSFDKLNRSSLNDRLGCGTDTDVGQRLKQLEFSQINECHLLFPTTQLSLGDDISFDGNSANETICIGNSSVEVVTYIEINESFFISYLEDNFKKCTKQLFQRDKLFAQMYIDWVNLFWNYFPNLYRKPEESIKGFFFLFISILKDNQVSISTQEYYLEMKDDLKSSIIDMIKIPHMETSLCRELGDSTFIAYLFRMFQYWECEYICDVIKEKCGDGLLMNFNKDLKGIRMCSRNKGVEETNPMTTNENKLQTGYETGKKIPKRKGTSQKHLNKKKINTQFGNKDVIEINPQPSTSGMNKHYNVAQLNSPQSSPDKETEERQRGEGEEESVNNFETERNHQEEEVYSSNKHVTYIQYENQPESPTPSEICKSSSSSSRNNNNKNNNNEPSSSSLNANVEVNGKKGRFRDRVGRIVRFEDEYQRLSVPLFNAAVKKKQFYCSKVEESFNLNLFQAKFRKVTNEIAYRLNIEVLNTAIKKKSLIASTFNISSRMILEKFNNMFNDDKDMRVIEKFLVKRTVEDCQGPLTNNFYFNWYRLEDYIVNIMSDNFDVNLIDIFVGVCLAQMEECDVKHISSYIPQYVMYGDKETMRERVYTVFDHLRQDETKEHKYASVLEYYICMIFKEHQYCIHMTECLLDPC